MSSFSGFSNPLKHYQEILWHFVENWNWPQNVSISVHSAGLSQSCQNTLSLQRVSQVAHKNWNSNIFHFAGGAWTSTLRLTGLDFSETMKRMQPYKGRRGGWSVHIWCLTQNFSPFFLFPNLNQGEIDVFCFFSGPINESDIWRRYTFAVKIKILASKFRITTDGMNCN